MCYVLVWKGGGSFSGHEPGAVSAAVCVRGCYTVAVRDGRLTVSGGTDRLEVQVEQIHWMHVVPGDGAAP